MVTIEDLWKIDDQIMAKWGKYTYRNIDYCGLEPIRPLENLNYFCTPKNSLTFARMGGDGVHFGIVDGKNEQGNNGPIVMTIPMADNNNIIVAEDLDEFLSIGYYNGWFALEQIVYDLDDTINYYSKPDNELTKEEQAFLEIVRKEFSIKHIPLSKERLSMLESKYFKLLEIDQIT